MSRDAQHTTDSAELRHRAEERLKNQPKIPPEIAALTNDQRLIHELQVHQIELELQNEELRDSRAEAESGRAGFMELYDFAPTGYVTLSSNSMITGLNLAAARLLGSERAKLRGQCLALFVAESDQRPFSDFLQQVFANQAKPTCEVKLSSPGQPSRIVQIDATLSPSEECHAILIDITEHRRVEEENQRFGRILEESLNEIFVFEADSLRFVRVNKGARLNLGYSMEDLTRLTPLDLQPELNRESFAALIEPLRSGQRDQIVLETVHRRKDGSTYPVEVHLQLSAGHHAEFFVAIVQDITERKQAQAALSESEHSLNLVLNALSSHIAVLDADGRIIATNRAWQNFAKENGFSGDPVCLGIPYLTALDRAAGSVEVNLFANQIRDVLAGRQMEASFEYPCHSPQQQRWFICRVTRFFGSDPIGVVMSHDNITERKQAEVALRASEERLRLTLENAQHGVWDWDITMGRSHLDDQWYAILGYADGERPPGYELWEQSLHPEDKSKVMEVLQRHLDYGDALYDVDYRARTKSGEWVWINSRGRVNQRDAGGKPLRMMGTIHDISARKQAEGKIREQARLLELIFEHSLDCIVLLDRNCNFVRVNQAYAKVCQRDVTVFPGHNYFDFVPSPLKEEFDKAIKQRVTYTQSDQPLMLPDHPELGVTYWDLSMVPIRNLDGETELILVTLKDVTIRILADKQLRRSLEEKNAVLKEVHHRVKNNLQVVTSLLHLQAIRVKEPATHAVLTDSQNRIRSMALVHETLYSFGDFGRIDLGDYLNRLCTQLAGSFNVDPALLKISIDVVDIQIDLEKAITCGLIVNELVSNVLKYAFPNQRRGRLQISATRESGTNHTLTIADDGVGFTSGIDLNRPQTLGLQLVQDLSRQLGGTLTCERINGTTFRLTFPIHAANSP